MSATKRVMVVNRRRHEAAVAVIQALRPLGDGIVGAWKAVLALERAAVERGVERERRRATKRDRHRIRIGTG